MHHLSPNRDWISATRFQRLLNDEIIKPDLPSLLLMRTGLSALGEPETKPQISSSRKQAKETIFASGSFLETTGVEASALPLLEGLLNPGE